MSNNDLLNKLFEKYNLIWDPKNPSSKDNDVYVHRHYKIITRGGIQKIERASGITCNIDIIASGIDYCIMRGSGTTLDGSTYVTYASANRETCQNGYYVEMAEKRCRSRLILTLAGLYETGLVFGQDEINEDDGTKVAKYKPA